MANDRDSLKSAEGIGAIKTAISGTSASTAAEEFLRLVLVPPMGKAPRRVAAGSL
jgi:hypothetical protein